MLFLSEKSSQTSCSREEQTTPRRSRWLARLSRSRRSVRVQNAELPVRSSICTISFYCNRAPKGCLPLLIEPHTGPGPPVLPPQAGPVPFSMLGFCASGTDGSRDRELASAHESFINRAQLDAASSRGCANCAEESTPAEDAGDGDAGFGLADSVAETVGDAGPRPPERRRWERAVSAIWN